METSSSSYGSERLSSVLQHNWAAGKAAAKIKRARVPKDRQLFCREATGETSQHTIMQKKKNKKLSKKVARLGRTWLKDRHVIAGGKADSVGFTMRPLNTGTGVQYWELTNNGLDMSRLRSPHMVWYTKI